VAADIERALLTVPEVATPSLEFVDRGSLPRSGYKSVRLVDA
jgi:hypothetical protein